MIVYYFRLPFQEVELLCTDSGKVGILGEISNHSVYGRREQPAYASPPRFCVGDWKYQNCKIVSLQILSFVTV